MIDKTSKAFLKYLSEQEDCCIYFHDGLEFPDQFGSLDDVYKMIEFLEQEEYLICNRPWPDFLSSVTLTHKGRHMKEFHRYEILKYISEKWIDFFAMLAASVAVVISLIALLTK